MAIQGTEKFNLYLNITSVNVNCCDNKDLLVDGVDIETLKDVDCYTACEPINTLNELELFMED